MTKLITTKLMRKLTSEIDQMLDFNDVSYAELARRMKVSPAHISDVMKRSTISLRFLERFCIAVGYKMTISFERDLGQKLKIYE